MCGIAGYVSSRQGFPRDALRGMAEAVAHRGPDDEGFLETTTRDGRYAFGMAHRRLSIIDLSTGHQPMGNEDGSVQIVYNGEVYNFQALREELIAAGHIFRTHSDTETIVHAYEQWGTDCVQRFRGMFAFAIWDAAREILFLVRDRFGKKPLFLCEMNGDLLFASEIKSILAVPGVSAAVDHDSVWDYLAYRYAPGPATMFKGIRKLNPGSWAIWEKGRLQEQCYYLPPDGLPRVKAPTLSDPVGAFLDVLDESVRVRMIADVPFGAFLSGGIDSSAVVGLMSRHSAHAVKTFSVGFHDERYSELQHAKAVAGQFRTEHHELVISQHDLIEHLPALVRFRDGPVSEPSDIPIYLLSLEARKTVKMVLTGEGADEFIGGYPKHVYERYARPYQMLPHWLRRGVLEPFVHDMPYRYQRIKTAVLNLGLEDFPERMGRWFGALSNAERAAMVALPRSSRELSAEPFASPTGNSALRRILFFDQMSWLPDNLLERGDRMTMAASLESRMPFIDRDMAAFVSALPDEYRVRGHHTKWILRQAMLRLLPASILNRKKVGFRVPVNEWFRGAMRDYLFDHLTGSGAMTSDYYHRSVLDRIMAEHADGIQNHEKLLWTLLSLEIWQRQYGIR